jgi:hypothetical protein
MNKFRDWYVRNQDAITWFIIGFLTLSIIENVSRQEYVWAVVQAVLIWINYKLSNVRLQ